MPFEPAHSDHAIVEVAFQIEFDRPFTGEELVALRALAREFRDDLPAYRELTLQRAGDPQMPSYTSVPPGVGSSGVELASLRRDASLEWRLLCADRFVTVNCTVYTRWERIWSAVKRYFGRVVDVTSVSGPRGSRAVTLEYVDEFIWNPRTTTPSFGELIHFDSELVPRDLSKRGAIWHLYQGWFEQPEDLLDSPQRSLPPGKLLERFHVDSAERSTIFEPEPIHFVRIHHMMRYELQGDPLPRADFSDGAATTSCFSVMHALNKRRLSEFLAKPMQERIGLDASSPAS